VMHRPTPIRLVADIDFLTLLEVPFLGGSPSTPKNPLRSHMRTPR